MSKSDFYLDINIKVPYLKDVLEMEADTRLRKLTKGHTDFVGASVMIEELSHDRTPHAYQARLIAHIRPEDITAVAEADSAEAALDQALTALERQIRSKREKLRERWEQPNVRVRMSDIYELTPREIFDTYFMDLTPEELSEWDRDGIATELITKEGLSDQAAYYAADQILVHVQERLDVE